MQGKEFALILVKVEKKEGVSKTTGKDYRFFTANVIGQNGDPFQLTFSKKLIEKDFSSEADIEKLLKLNMVHIEATLSFKPKGYAVTGEIVDFELTK